MTTHLCNFNWFLICYALIHASFTLTRTSLFSKCADASLSEVIRKMRQRVNPPLQGTKLSTNLLILQGRHVTCKMYEQGDLLKFDALRISGTRAILCDKVKYLI